MFLKTDRKILLHLLILLAVGLAGVSCGKKAPPRPPGREEAPAAVGHISKVIRGDTLSLTWDPVAGKEKDIAGFYVYRSKMRLTDSDCRSCPVLFERVAVIPKLGQGTGAATLRPYEYQETLESGYRYSYKVAPYSQSGLTGKESDPVEVVR
jgi:hypothetical protein